MNVIHPLLCNSNAHSKILYSPHALIVHWQSFFVGGELVLKTNAFEASTGLIRYNSMQKFEMLQIQ